MSFLLAVGVHSEIYGKMPEKKNDNYCNYVYEWKFFGDGIHNLIRNKCGDDVICYYLPHYKKENKTVKFENIVDGYITIIADELTLLKSEEQLRFLTENARVIGQGKNLNIPLWLAVSGDSPNEREQLKAKLENYYQITEISKGQKIDCIFPVTQQTSHQKEF